MKTKELPYGPVNVEAFQEVKRHILEEPKRFNMEDWAIDCAFVPPEERPPCGTVACIAGWALALHHLKTHKTLRTCAFAHPSRAASLLGLGGIATSIDGNFIPFHVSLWPSEFRNRYFEANTPAKRARAAAAFIDYVCGL